MRNILEIKPKKSCEKGKVSSFRQINRLKNACNLARKENESSIWGELFEREMLFTRQIMTDTIFTKRTEEIFVNGHRYHVFS